MDVTIKIKRYDPEVEAPESYWQDFSLTLDDSATVLDGLIKIREEMDGTLSLRCSCRSAICGSCATRINGHAGLAFNRRRQRGLPLNNSASHQIVPASSAACSVGEMAGMELRYRRYTGSPSRRQRSIGIPSTIIGAR